MLTRFIPRLPRGTPLTFYRYVHSEITRPFFGSMLFFLFVLLMFQIIRLSDFFIVHSVPLIVVGKMMVLLGLTFVPIILPISFLLASLLGYGRLSADGEITAMRASGLSMRSLLWPSVSFGAMVAVVNLLAYFYFVPWASRMFRYELFRISNTKAIATVHEGTFTEGFFGLVLYADKVDSKQNVLHKVLMYDERDQTNPVTVVAGTGQILNNYQDTKGVPGLVLRLFNGSIHRGTPERMVYELIEFDSYDIFLGIEIGKILGVEAPKTMDIHRLNEHIKDRVPDSEANQDYIHDTRMAKVEYWRRYALPASCLMFAVLGVAFGIVRTRTVRSHSFLICLLVLAGYWGIYSVGESMATKGAIPAPVGVWAADVLLALVAAISYKRMAR